MVDILGSNVIIASAHSFEGDLKLGSAQLARSFAASGCATLYINPPISPLHLAHPRSRASALRKVRSVFVRKATGADGISVLTPFTAFPHVNAPLFRGQSTLNHWPTFAVPSTVRQIERAGFIKPSLVLFDSVVFWPLIKRLGVPSVYRVADRIDQFAVNTQAMVDLHRNVVRSADLVVFTARDLAPKPEERQGPMLYLPNGVDFDLFQRPQPRPPEYDRLEGPLAVYAGAIDDWFDLDELVAAARTLSQVQFIIIGPSRVPLDRLGAFANVHILGPRPHAALPAYLQHADVGLIPFDLKRHRALLDSVCPLKLFEYLATGLPVVSYAGAEVRALQAPIVLYGSQDGSATESLDAAILNALSEDLNQSRADRVEFARRADWSSRLQSLEAALSDAGILGPASAQ